MDYLPVSWRLGDSWALLVGGGHLALRKARLLCRAGTRLRVVAPEINPELAELVKSTGGVLHVAGFSDTDLDEVSLVVCATDNEAVNRQVHAAATARHLPVNVVDQPELSTFIFPAIIDRDPLLISISSGGGSPLLARWLRSRIEAWLPARWGRVATLMAEFRQQVADRLPEVGARRLFWEKVLDGGFAERVLSGRETEARDWLTRAIGEADRESLEQGEVYLVGAGPGDADLMTFRALRLLQKADVVLYDRLVSPEVLELARRDADLVYVGKERDRHSLPQDNINDLLVHYARQGLKVCRLKGGDPFIFGRGGEEIGKIAEAGIDFQVVPGITAASGCAAYAGIPLTHRDHAQSVRFVTGHRKKGGASLDWTSLITPAETLVFYMGLVSLPEISRELIAHGMDPAMPAALISRGTTEAQEVYTGTIRDLPDKVAAREVHAPTLIIVGEVAGLYPKLAWFGARQE